MLTRDELIDAIGAIDADLVEDFVRTDERLQKKKDRRVSPMMRFVALAACFALILASVPVMARLWREQPSEPPQDSVPGEAPDYNTIGFSSLEELYTFVYGSQLEQLDWLRGKYKVGHPSDKYVNYTYDEAKYAYDFTKRITKQPIPIIYYDEPTRNISLKVYYGSMDQHISVQYKTFGFSVFYPSEKYMDYIQNGDLEGYYENAHPTFARPDSYSKENFLEVKTVKLDRTDMDSKAILFTHKISAQYIEFIRDGLIIRITTFQNYGSLERDGLIALANELVIEDVNHPGEKEIPKITYEDVLKQQLDEETYQLLTDETLYDDTMKRVDLTQKPILKIYHNVFWEHDEKSKEEIQQLAEQEGKLLYAVFDKEIYLVYPYESNGNIRIGKREFEYHAPEYLSYIVRCETALISNDGKVQTLKEILCFDSMDDYYGATVYCIYSEDVWVRHYNANGEIRLVMRLEEFESVLGKYREIRSKVDPSDLNDKGIFDFRTYYFNQDEYDIKYDIKREDANDDQNFTFDEACIYWIIPAVVLSGVGVVFVIWKKKRHQK